MEWIDRSETSEKRNRSRTLGRQSSLPLDPLTPSVDEYARLRAFRVLIYADMVRRTGKVLFDKLATWDYQPTEEEVTAAMADYTTVKAADRERERRRLAKLKTELSEMSESA